MALRPQTVYGQLSDLQATVGLYFFRQSAKTIGTPEGIIETLSDEYTYFHPDPDGTVVVVGADAGQPMQDGTRGDPTLRRKRWDVCRTPRPRLAPPPESTEA